MIELVRDHRVINVLAKFENDPWKIMDVRVIFVFRNRDAANILIDYPIFTEFRI